MHKLIEEEIYSTIFDNFRVKANEKLNDISNKMQIEFSNKDFNINKFLELSKNNKDKFIYNLEEKIDSVIKKLNKKIYENEIEMSSNIDDIVGNMKQIDSYILAPKEYEEIAINLDKENRYNDIYLVDLIRKDVGELFKEIIKELFLYSDDYKNNYIDNLNEIFEQIEKEKDLSKSASLLIQIMEEFLKDEEMTAAIRSIKSRREFSLLQISQEISQFNYRKNQKRDNKMISNNITDFKLNMNFEIKSKETSNINKVYKKRFSNIYVNKYENLLKKYFGRVK